MTVSKLSEDPPRQVFVALCLMGVEFGLAVIRTVLLRDWSRPVPAFLAVLLDGNGMRKFYSRRSLPTNSRSLAAFRYHVTGLWHRTLRRRSQKGLDDLGADFAAGGGVPSSRPHSSPLAGGPFCRQAPEVGARCANRARRDLCGGRPVTGVPTAILILRPSRVSKSHPLRH